MLILIWLTNLEPLEKSYKSCLFVLYRLCCEFSMQNISALKKSIHELNKFQNNSFYKLLRPHARESSTTRGSRNISKFWTWCRWIISCKSAEELLALLTTKIRNREHNLEFNYLMWGQYLFSGYEDRSFSRVVALPFHLKRENVNKVKRNCQT